MWDLDLMIQDILFNPVTHFRFFFCPILYAAFFYFVLSVEDFLSYGIEDVAHYFKYLH